MAIMLSMTPPDGLIRTHYVVPVCVALDPLVGLPRVLGEDLVQALLVMISSLAWISTSEA